RQNSEIATGRDRDRHFHDADAHHVFHTRPQRQTLERYEIASGALEMHDELQILPGTQRRLAENRAAVEDAQPSHFEKITQELRAASFERLRTYAIELDDVVRDQATAATHELQRKLALAHTRCAGDEHANAEHVE